MFKLRLETEMQNDTPFLTRRIKKKKNCIHSMEEIKMKMPI